MSRIGSVNIASRALLLALCIFSILGLHSAPGALAFAQSPTSVLETEANGAIDSSASVITLAQAGALQSTQSRKIRMGELEISEDTKEDDAKQTEGDPGTPRAPLIENGSRSPERIAEQPRDGVLAQSPLSVGDLAPATTIRMGELAISEDTKSDDAKRKQEDPSTPRVPLIDDGSRSPERIAKQPRDGVLAQSPLSVGDLAPATTIRMGELAISEDTKSDDAKRKQEDPSTPRVPLIDDGSRSPERIAKQPRDGVLAQSPPSVGDLAPATTIRMGELEISEPDEMETIPAGTLRMTGINFEPIRKEVGPLLMIGRSRSDDVVRRQRIARGEDRIGRLPRHVKVSLLRVRPLEETGTNPFDFVDVRRDIETAQVVAPVVPPPTKPPPINPPLTKPPTNCPTADFGGAAPPLHYDIAAVEASGECDYAANFPVGTNFNDGLFVAGACAPAPAPAFLDILPINNGSPTIPSTLDCGSCTVVAGNQCQLASPGSCNVTATYAVNGGATNITLHGIFTVDAAGDSCTFSNGVLSGGNFGG